MLQYGSIALPALYWCWLTGVVTRTIAGGIAKPSTFAKYPSVFMFGELGCSTAASEPDFEAASN